MTKSLSKVGILVLLIADLLLLHLFLCTYVKAYDRSVQRFFAHFTQSPIKIFMTFHKPYQLPAEGRGIEPIQVGRAVEHEPFQGGQLTTEEIKWLHENMIGDDTGDNISAKNRSFDVLTAYYWVWKHYREVGNPKYIGFFAHRKYLILRKDGDNDYNYGSREFLRILAKYKIIYVPMAIAYENAKHPISLYEAYKINHHIEDFEAMLSIIKRDYPDIYKTAENIIFDEDRVYAAWNYWVMEKTLAFDYFEKLFHIMFELEKVIGSEVSKRDFYQRRVFGFLAERFFAIWLEHQRIKNHIKPYEAFHYFSD